MLASRISSLCGAARPCAKCSVPQAAYDAHLRSDSNTRTIAHVNRAGLDIRLRKVAFVSGVCCSRQGYLWYSGYSQNSSGEGTHLRAWRVLLVPPLELRVPRLELLVILVLLTSRMSASATASAELHRIPRETPSIPPNQQGMDPQQRYSAHAAPSPACGLAGVARSWSRSSHGRNGSRRSSAPPVQCRGAVCRCVAVSLIDGSARECRGE